MKKISISIVIALFLSGCATHPTVSTTPMVKGEKRYGWSWSAENVFPYLWYRYGISEKDDIGLRVGPAIYGTGIDYSRILFIKKNKWDVLNLSWSMNPNYNSDFTYYKFKQRINKDDSKGAISWWGIRMMYIPKGITGGTSTRMGFLLGGQPNKESHSRTCSTGNAFGTSTRMGFLLGGQPNKKWGYEIGYNHDFSSIPITNLFDFNWTETMKSDENLERRYGDILHTDPASGLPTEYSRLTGLSLRLFFNLSFLSPADS